MKTKLLVALAALLSFETQSLFCQESTQDQFVNTDIITVEKYFTFLKATLPHGTTDRDCIPAPSIGIGTLCNNDYPVIDQPHAPMVFISWDDASHYCEWSHCDASLACYPRGTAFIDHALKSNRLSFQLLHAETNFQQAHGPQPLDNALLEEVIDVVFILGLGDAGVRTTESHSESAETSTSSYAGVPILKNKEVESHGKLLKSKALPLKSSQYDCLITMEQPSAEDHVRWDLREEADTLLAEIKELESQPQLSEKRKSSALQNANKEILLQEKKKKWAQVESLWEVLMNLTEKKLTILVRQAQAIQEPKTFWKKRDQEAVELRKKDRISKQEETDRLDLREKADQLWRTMRLDLDQHISGIEFLGDETKANNTTTTLVDEENDEVAVRHHSHCNSFLTYSDDWFAKAKFAYNITEDQNLEIRRKECQARDREAVQKRALFNEEKSKIRIKAAEEKKWQEEVARWNLMAEIIHHELLKARMDKEQLSLQKKTAQEDGSPTKLTRKLKRTLSDQSQIGFEIKKFKACWRELASESDHLRTFNKQSSDSAEEALQLLYTHDAAATKARNLIFKKCQRKRLASSSSFHTLLSSTQANTTEQLSHVASPGEDFENDTNLSQADEDAFIQYAKNLSHEAIDEVRTARPADSALASWQSKVTQSKQRAQTAQCLARLSEGFIEVFKKEEPHLASIQKHIKQELEKKSSREQNRFSEIATGVTSTIIQALGLPEHLAESTAKLAVRATKKTLDHLSEQLASHLTKNLSSTFSIQTLIDFRKKIAARCQHLSEAYETAYHAAQQENERLAGIEHRTELLVQEEEERTQRDLEHAATEHLSGNPSLWLSLKEDDRDVYNRTIEATNADEDEKLIQAHVEAVRLHQEAQKALQDFQDSPTKQAAHFFNGNKKTYKQQLHTAVQNSVHHLATVKEQQEQRTLFLNWGKLTPVERAVQLANESKRAMTDTALASHLLPHFQETSHNWNHVAFFWDQALSPVAQAQEMTSHFKKIAYQFQEAAEHQQKLIEAISTAVAQENIQKLKEEYYSIQSSIKKQQQVVSCLKMAATTPLPMQGELWRNVAEALKIDDLDLAKLYKKAAETIAENNELATFYLKAAAAKKENKSDLYKLWLQATSSTDRLQEFWKNAAKALEENKEETSLYFSNAAEAMAHQQEKLTLLWEQAALATKDKPRQLWLKAALALQHQNEKLSHLWESAARAVIDKQNNLSSFFDQAASALQDQNEPLSDLWVCTAIAFQISNYQLSDPTFLRWKEAAEAFSKGHIELSYLLTKIAKTKKQEIHNLWNQAIEALKSGNSTLSALFQHAAEEESMRPLWHQAALALQQGNQPLSTLFENAARANNDELRSLWHQAALALQERNQSLSKLFENAALASDPKSRQLWHEAALALQQGNQPLSTLFENAARANNNELRSLCHQAALALQQGNQPLSVLFENAAQANQNELRSFWCQAALALQQKNQMLSMLFEQAALANDHESRELWHYAASSLQQRNQPLSKLFENAALAEDSALRDLWKEAIIARKSQDGTLLGYYTQAAKALQDGNAKLSALWEKVAIAHKENKSDLRKLWHKAAQAAEKNKDSISEVWIKSATALLNHQYPLSELWKNNALAKERNLPSAACWEEAALALRTNQASISYYWKRAALEIEDGNDNSAYFWKEAVNASTILELYKTKANQALDPFQHQHLLAKANLIERAIQCLVHALEPEYDAQTAQQAFEEILEAESMDDEPSSCIVS